MFDITSMLGNTNANSSSGSSFGSFNFADYAAIKNGSYGKLVKSYYASGEKTVTQQKSASSKTADTSRAKTASKADDTGLTTLKKDADQLKTSTEALGKDDLWKAAGDKADAGRIADAVKDFADKYNKVIDQASKVSSKEVATDVKFMKSMTDTFSKVLAKAGINVGDDGKLSVDTEALGKADNAVIKSLFSGNGTYGSQIADKASAINRDAELGSSIYGSDATTTSALTSVYNQFI